MLEHVFFSGWRPVVRTAVATSASYVILIVLLRFAGSRVLAKWYAFDRIITVALGSTFATNVLSKDTTVAEAGRLRPARGGPPARQGFARGDRRGGARGRRQPAA